VIHIYSFDPGLVTGWCHISVHEGEVGIFNCGESDHLQIGNMLYDNNSLRYAVDKPEIDISFVCESFTMSPKKTPAPWSLETIGLIRYFAERNQVPFHLQTPSQAKNLISNDVIKRAGLYKPGQGHAMDSIRHALYFLIVKKNVLSEVLR
jgi:hypothetical protein